MDHEQEKSEVCFSGDCSTLETGTSGLTLKTCQFYNNIDAKGALGKDFDAIRF